MPNLAGYDLIIEVARAAIEREMLNTPFASGPNTPANDTLVPPFILTRNVPLPGMSGTLWLKVSELHLRAQPGSALVTMQMIFEECSLEAPGVDLHQLGGQCSVTAPLYFTPPAGTPSASRLVIDFNQATSSLALDPASISQMDQAVGPMLGGAIRSGLDTSLSALFKKQGLVNLNFSFLIDNTRDSASLMTLTAVPDLMWIDGECLGIFGYHRHAASTGLLNTKTTADLPPVPYPGYPSDQFAILLSPFSFHQLVACPSIRTVAVDHVAGRYREQWINEVRAYNHNDGPATPAEVALVESYLNAYVRGSQRGIQETDACTPAPCGQGMIDQHVDLPDPFPGTTAYVTWLSMELGNGQIDIKASARTQIFCTRISVQAPMAVKPVIGLDNSIKAGPLTRGPVNTDIDDDIGCDVATRLLLFFVRNPYIDSISILLKFGLIKALGENLISDAVMKADLPAPNTNAGSVAKLPAGVKLKEIFIDPTALTIQGQWEGMVNDPHRINPAVRFFWQTSHIPSTAFNERSSTFEASCGGEPRTFHYRSKAWDTSVAFTIDIGDVPRPIRYDDWYLWHNGVAHKLAAGTLTFPGEVVVPIPPDLEKLEHRDAIVVNVTGSNDQGFTLNFRAEDDNVVFSIFTRVVDGSGRPWPLGGNNLSSQGLTFLFDQEYTDFREECARYIVGVGSRYQLWKEVPVWEKVASIENILGERMAGNRPLGVAQSLRQIMIEQPEITKQFFSE
jgi:hypothetical protein